MSPPTPRPRLRYTAMRHVRADGNDAFALSPLHPAHTSPLLIPAGAGPLLNWLDGQHPLDDLLARFRLVTGRELHPDLLRNLLRDLDRAGLLDWSADPLPTPTPLRRLPRFEAAWLGYGPLLRDNLHRLTHLASPTAESPIHALLSPHIDLHRGHAAYAAAWSALRRTPLPDLYVILGTSHQATAEPFNASRRAYHTPFGDLHVDDDLLHALVDGFGPGLLRGEHLHDHEHSIEFQALFIAFLHHTRNLPPPRILPILCGPLPHHRSHAPDTHPTFLRFTRSLRDLLDARPTRPCLVAGVDLAHLGPQFGDPLGLDAGGLRRLRDRDLTTLHHAAHLDPAAFWDDVTADRNARRICGLTPTYTLLHLMPPHTLTARLLHYDQAVDPVGNVVSYAAAAFWSDA